MAENQGPILMTGITGFIPSHTLVTLLPAGYDVVGFDNFSNSTIESLKRVEELANRRVVDFWQFDLRDMARLEDLFKKYHPSSVIHFAGLKSVGESKKKPLEYFDNNIAGSLNLFTLMEKYGVRKLVFSSSATVYCPPLQPPFKEDMSLFAKTENPYGRSKLHIEGMIEDIAAAYGWDVALLRYFNPIGAHPSGRIGEDPQGIPNNLFPFITRVAAAVMSGDKSAHVTVHGNDYETKPDGTGKRDYIHVMDLGDAHVDAVRFANTNQGVHIFNIGRGTSDSVLQVIQTFEDVNRITVPYKIGPRRGGDLPECYADVTKAREVLGWNAKRGLADMCRDGWNWQKNNPQGYRSS